MLQNVNIIATTAMGLESIVAREVKQLGYEVTVENSKVKLNAPLSAIPRLNLWLRSADRVKIEIGGFRALSFDELFEQTKALPWEDYIPEDGAFPVSGKSHKSKLFSVSDCQRIVKKSIAERLKLKHGYARKMPETGALYKIEVALLKDIATLTIDTSGVGLHKRGYRLSQGEAPLKETMAAALIQLTNWHPNHTFIDPFCGSGTIPIEAAMIGQNIAPGFNREFASENWNIISQKLWDNAFTECEDLAKYDQPLHIIGSDIDHNMIKISQENALEAGFGDLITWKQMQVSDLSIKQNNGYIVSNPPYGERLKNKEAIAQAYRDIGTIMRELPSWSVYILTAYKQFEKEYGQKARKKRKLFNGFIETNYYQYFGKQIRE